MKIMSVVGARPNFMKIAPIARELKKVKSITHILVHTGQHYDKKMSDSFFKELDIPQPQVNLGVGSGTHAVQTARVMEQFEKVVVKHKPDLVMVVGDVNSTLACSLVAAKLHIPVAHIEAGLRSGDRAMPEEINRVVTDSVSDMLFTTCRDADKNLRREGVAKEKIFFVGNVMIDTLMHNKKKARQLTTVQDFDLRKKKYALITLHRPSNVDAKTTFKNILAAIAEIQCDLPVVFPAHPRTRKHLSIAVLAKMPQVLLCDPLSYLSFLNLMMHAKLVITDSGGIQEETTVLGVPCLTVRENTERPVTITQGTNYLVGTDKDRIVRTAKKIMRGKGKTGVCPELWDGKAAKRIVNILKKC